MNRQTQVLALGSAILLSACELSIDRRYLMRTISSTALPHHAIVVGGATIAESKTKEGKVFYPYAQSRSPCATGFVISLRSNDRDRPMHTYNLNIRCRHEGEVSDTRIAHATLRSNDWPDDELAMYVVPMTTRFVRDGFPDYQCLKTGDYELELAYGAGNIARITETVRVRYIEKNKVRFGRDIIMI